ncbi:hypothetical protein M2128_000666 [Polynucleobacter sphagniphilus]|jgi:hypothetical protein|nr:hypothetical protein [Polynucleobacter sphagniphilus]
MRTPIKKPMGEMGLVKQLHANFKTDGSKSHLIEVYL